MSKPVMTLKDWENLYRACTSMSLDSISEVLDENNWAHNAMVLLEYRSELSALCRSKGVSRYLW